MNIAALLTSAGINIAVCVVLFSLYSVLRKQPGNANVYFGPRLASHRLKRLDLCLERFVPSPSWILKAWETTEEEILKIGGLDAVVLIRILVFSIRVFAIAAIICIVLVLPVNYYGQNQVHKHIPLESLEVFTIENVKGSKWLWAHCLALYIITCAACSLLYFEYKSITKLRLQHITESRPNPNPSHFAILVRAIPWSPEESYSDKVTKFFSSYHASSYLSHQMVYKSGAVQKIKVTVFRNLSTNLLLQNAQVGLHMSECSNSSDDAEQMYKILMGNSLEEAYKSTGAQCCFCGGPTNSFKILSNETERTKERTSYPGMHIDGRKKECAAAFVFFRSRYAALVAAQILQTSNPMFWVTDPAPEPLDVYWSNLCIPYRQLWIRKIATLVASIAFVLVFVIPVTFVQGLTKLDRLQKTFPFLTGILQKKFVGQMVTGYLPSVILMLFLYAVPPMMMLFSSVEGSISRSGRKKSACCKILYFIIWNVFFVNILTGTVIDQLTVFSSIKDVPVQLAKAVPVQSTFFITYVLSSGWASLAIEVMQIFPLFCNLVQRYVLRYKDDSRDGTLSFPYHTEVSRILLFGFLGFTCSILAPLILPFLLFYFFLAYLVYRNQILNVYTTRYDSGGQFWPIAHNATVFSLILTQVIALGIFGIKRSSVASGFTIPLIIGTLLFHEYCRQRFLPVFRNNSAEDLINMDHKDENSGRMEEIYQRLSSDYCQFFLTATGLSHSECLPHRHELHESAQDFIDSEKGNEPLQRDGQCTDEGPSQRDGQCTDEGPSHSQRDEQCTDKEPSHIQTDVQCIVHRSPQKTVAGGK